MELSRKRNSGTHHDQKSSELNAPSPCLHRAVETQSLDTTLVRQRDTSRMECCCQREWVEVGRRSGSQVDERGQGAEYEQLEDCKEIHGGVVVANELTGCAEREGEEIKASRVAENKWPVVLFRPPQIGAPGTTAGRRTLHASGQSSRPCAHAPMNADHLTSSAHTAGPHHLTPKTPSGTHRHHLAK